MNPYDYVVVVFPSNKQPQVVKIIISLRKICPCVVTNYEMLISLFVMCQTGGKKIGSLCCCSVLVNLEDCGFSSEGW